MQARLIRILSLLLLFAVFSSGCEQSATVEDDDRDRDDGDQESDLDESVPDGDSDFDWWLPGDGDSPDGDNPDGDNPDGDSPDGDNPDGDDPDGDDPDGDVPDGDQDGEQKRIRIGTYNVKRFFNTTCDSGHCGEDEWEPLVSAAAYNDRLTAISGALSIINADIMLLQEIETRGCAEDLSNWLEPRYPVVVLGETGYDASLDVAVLSGGELVSVIDHGDESLPLSGGGSTTFLREFPEVHLDFDGTRVIVFPAHFKSKASDDPAQRLAEAQGAYRIVSAVAGRYPHALVVMGGDLNDTPGSPPLAALETGDALKRVADELTQDRDATYSYRGDPQAIDHLFWGQQAGGAYIAGSAQVVKDGQIYLGDSDHAALRADFFLPE